MPITTIAGKTDGAGSPILERPWTYTDDSIALFQSGAELSTVIMNEPKSSVSYEDQRFNYIP